MCSHALSTLNCVGAGARFKWWEWSVGSVVGTPYHASLTAHRQLCVARKANPLGAGTIPVTAQTCRRNNSSFLLWLVRFVEAGGDLFCSNSVRKCSRWESNPHDKCEL